MDPFKFVEIAQSLDDYGNYREADLFLDQMLRFSKKRKTWRGNPNARPRTPMNPMPGAKPAPIIPQVAAPVAPQPVAPVSSAKLVDDISLPRFVKRAPDPNAANLARTLYGLDQPIKPDAPQVPAPVTPQFRPDGTPLVPVNPIPVPKATSLEFFQNIGKKAIEEKWTFKQLDSYLDKYNLDRKDEFIKIFNQRNGPNKYQDTLDKLNTPRGPQTTKGPIRASDIPALTQLTKHLNTKPGQKLLTAIKAAYDKFLNAFNLIKNKIPPAALKIFSKIKFVFIFLNFVKFFNGLINGTLTYKETIEFIAACAAISKEVLVFLGLIPYVGPGLVTAVIAINFGAADIAQFIGDPESGFNFMGFQITGESAKRRTDKIDFATVDVKTLDPAVQSALREAIPLIQSGMKSREIISSPEMLQKHPWLKGDDIRFTQFIGALGQGGFYRHHSGKQNSSQQSNQTQPTEETQTQPTEETQNQPTEETQNQPVYNNRRQMPKLNNHNDLLYKAYVDTVQSTNITLENMKNYRDQIISKIQALASNYPNINAQQAITALDNRIRKYSTQATPT